MMSIQQMINKFIDCSPNTPAKEDITVLQSVFAEYRQIVRDETITEIQQIMNNFPIMQWGDKINSLKENNNDVL